MIIALVGAFNQEKALVGAFSVIVQPVVEPMDRFAALVVCCNQWSKLTDISFPIMLLLSACRLGRQAHPEKGNILSSETMQNFEADFEEKFLKVQFKWN